MGEDGVVWVGKKSRERTESTSAGSWVMKSHVPPLGLLTGWEKMEIRPEHELVV